MAGRYRIAPTCRSRIVVRCLRHCALTDRLLFFFRLDREGQCRGFWISALFALPGVHPILDATDVQAAGKVGMRVLFLLLIAPNLAPVGIVEISHDANLSSSPCS